jgi:hypothetical protein
MTEDRRDAIMRKVQGLLAKAESTTFGPEQEALLEKADKLMLEYAIAQHEIDQMGKPGDRVKPEMREFGVSQAGTHLWYELTLLAQECAQFFDCRGVYSGLQGRGKWAITAKVVGFPESVRAAEQLYTSLKIQLMASVNPKYEVTLSLDDNICAMKDSGQTWSYIYAELKRHGIDWCQEQETRSHLGRIKRIYDKRKEALGEEPVKANPKNFQTNFANGFIGAISSRMADIKEARKAATEEATTSDGTSVSIVLRSRQEEVAEAYRAYFPSVGRGVSKGSSKSDAAARGAGHRAGSSADLSGATRNVGGTKGAIG